MLEGIFSLRKCLSLMYIASTAVAGLTVSATMATTLIFCERRDGRPHCESRMAGLTNIMWAPMADLNMSAAMAGLTNVLWVPMADLTDFPLLLWAPMSDITDVSFSPVGADG